MDALEEKQNSVSARMNGAVQLKDGTHNIEGFICPTRRAAVQRRSLQKEIAGMVRGSERVDKGRAR